MFVDRLRNAQMSSFVFSDRIELTLLAGMEYNIEVLISLCVTPYVYIIDFPTAQRNSYPNTRLQCIRIDHKRGVIKQAL